MGELDVSLRRLVRGSPQPLLQLAFPGRALESLGPFDASVDRPRQRTSDNLFRVRDGALEAAVHVEIEREWRPALARLPGPAGHTTPPARRSIGAFLLLPIAPGCGRLTAS